MNKHLALILIYVATLFATPVVSAADKEAPNPSALFALCPVSDKNDPDHKMFSFEHAVKKRNSTNFSSGFYNPKAVVDFGQVNSVTTDIVEMGAAPFTGIVFGFTDDGYARLAAHLKSKSPSDLVLLLDGRSYETIDKTTLERIVKDRSKLIVFIAEPSSNIGHHLIELLVAKLRAKLPKK